MKIIYIGSFKRLYDEEGIARSFEKLGCNVIRYEEKGFTEEQVDEIIASDAEVLLFAKLKTPTPYRQQLIDQFKGKTVCYVPDLYWGLKRRYLVTGKDPIFQADYVCTPDGGNNKKWKKWGVNHYCVRQGIFDEEIKRIKGDNNNDVLFVGSLNAQFPYRAKLMAYLENNFDLRWMGDMSDSEIRGDALTTIFGDTKVVIGDSVQSPYYWSNRIYETIGRGGFIIHPMIEGLDKDYEPYKHFIPYEYGDFNGLGNKIRFFIKNKEEREKIIEAGMEHTKKHHTLIKRCEQILCILGYTLPIKN